MQIICCFLQKSSHSRKQRRIETKNYAYLCMIRANNNMRVKANCKINLGLHIVRKREDGYHDLESIMLPVRGLYDIIYIERAEGDAIEFENEGIAVDCPADKNIMVRAARLMQQRYGIGGVKMRLDKRVPFGAGLGGGSSDATAVILAINDLYDLKLDKPTLVTLAAELGSDTPFFVHNSAQYCTGRGEIMEDISLSLDGLWLAVVKPDDAVSTAEAYSGVTPHLPDVNLCDVVKRPIAEWREKIVNDFEPNIFEYHPKIAELKELLYRSGALYASMSGSGSALFGIFDRRPAITVGDDVFLHIEQL